MKKNVKDGYVAPESFSVKLVSESMRMALEIERKDMCWYRTQARVEVCTHPGYTADTCPYHKHQ